MLCSADIQKSNSIVVSRSIKQHASLHVLDHVLPQDVGVC